MKTTNILIMESDDEFAAELNECFAKQDDFNVCAVTDNGNTAISLFEQFKPEIVVMNLVLSGVDGFGVMDHIRDSGVSCQVIVMSNFDNNQIIKNAIKHGARYYFIKPVSPQSVCDRLRDLLSTQNTDYRISSDTRDKRRVASIDEKISNIFISIGIPPHIKGYAYLREGIKMAIEDPKLINNVTKELYPSIGKKFDTSASKVERAIRHAIEVAWNRGRVDAINAIFGVRVYIGSEKPTNSEFIALVADKLILEELL